MTHLYITEVILVICNHCNFDNFLFDDLFESMSPAMPSCPWKRFSCLWDEITDHLTKTAPTYSDAVNRAEHILDVAHIVNCFAKVEGWSRRKRNTAITAALIHDFSKFDCDDSHAIAAARYVYQNRSTLDDRIPYGEKIWWKKAAFAIALHSGRWKFGLRELLTDNDFDAFEIAVLLRIADKLAHGGSRARKAWNALKDADAVLRWTWRIFPYFCNRILHPYSRLIRSELIQAT